MEPGLSPSYLMPLGKLENKILFHFISCSDKLLVFCLVHGAFMIELCFTITLYGAIKLIATKIKNKAKLKWRKRWLITDTDEWRWQWIMEYLGEVTPKRECAATVDYYYIFL